MEFRVRVEQIDPIAGVVFPEQEDVGTRFVGWIGLLRVVSDVVVLHDAAPAYLRDSSDAAGRPEA